MKALFIGLGSVGQRHLQNFTKLRPQYTSILAYRTTRLDKVIKNGNIIQGKTLADYYNITEFNNIDNALNENPDVSFICNPNNLHIETAFKIAERGVHLFIEKPLSITESGITELESKILENNLINMVGYQTRFHPLALEVNNIVKSSRYGEVISSEFKWCTYLPDHHPYEDYRTGYAARKDLGGGVIFCLIHELDIIQWFFGLPVSVYASRGGASKLELDVDDNVLAIFKCKVANNIFPVNLSISFSQKHEQRFFSILFQRALLKCNLLTNEIEIIEHNNNDIYNNSYNDVDRNSLFIKEMEAFLLSVENKISTNITVSEGKKSVLMAISMHQSIDNNRIIDIKKE